MATTAAERRPPADEWRRPLPFGLAVLLAILVLVDHGLSALGLIHAALVAVLVALAAVDLARRIIPNRGVLPATAAILAAQLVRDPGRWYEWVFAAVGAAVFLALPALVVRGGVGAGDIKLALLLGAGLGAAVVDALFYAALGAWLLAVAILVRRGRAGRRVGFPFGPFLAIGGIVAVFTGHHIGA